MPIMFWNGQLLFRNGQLAMGPACCCVPAGCGCDVGSLDATLNVSGCSCMDSGMSVSLTKSDIEDFVWEDSCVEWFGTIGDFSGTCTLHSGWLGYYINIVFGCTDDGTYRLQYNVNGGGSDTPCATGVIDGTVDPTALSPFSITYSLVLNCCWDGSAWQSVTFEIVIEEP